MGHQLRPHGFPGVKRTTCRIGLLRRACPATLLLLALVGSPGVLTGCAGLSDADRGRLADVEVATLSDAIPLVEAGLVETYGAWGDEHGAIYRDAIDPADSARADWRIMNVCVTEHAEQYLFVPPEQFDDMVDEHFDRCAP